MHVHVRFYMRPHRNINTHIFNTKGSKQIQSNHVSFHGVDENNDDRDEGDGVLLLRPLLLLVPGPLNKESGYISEIHFRSTAVRISPLSDYKSSAHGHSELLAAKSHHQERRICLPEKPTQRRQRHETERRQARVRDEPLVRTVPEPYSQRLGCMS